MKRFFYLIGLDVVMAIDCIIGVITLTVWRPMFVLRFAGWFANRFGAL